jgi:hypothetical protein
MVKIDCEWSQDEYDDFESGAWNADCGETFYICEGTPAENGIKFCCFCGKPLKQKIYKEDIE